MCVLATTQIFFADTPPSINPLTFARIASNSSFAFAVAIISGGLDGIRVATMHRVKGLEFQYVFVVAANNRIIPLASAIDHTDAVSEQETMTAEKCLLYVALTRAQKGAYISGYGKMSEFLQGK